MQSYNGVKLRKLCSTTVMSLLLVACNSPEESAQNHLQKGKEYFEKGEFDKAILELKSSNQADKRAETYYYMALLDEKNRRFKAMRENLVQALELKQDFQDARLKLSKLDLLSGDFKNSLDNVDKILQAKPDDVDALLLKASVFIGQQKNADALEIIDKVLANNPDNIEALTQKAGMFYSSGDLGQALVFIDKALLKDEKSISLHLFKIKINAKQDRLDDVVNEYKTLIKLYPDGENFKLSLSSIYAMTGQLQPAELLLRELIEKAPDKVEPKFILLEFLKAKSKEHVPEELQKLMVLHKEQSTILFELSRWMVTSGYWDLASQGLDQVAKLEADSNAGLTAKAMRAEIALNQKKFEEAEQRVNEILKVNPNFSDANLLKAKMLLKQKNSDSAIELLNKIVWSKNDSDNAYMLLGQAYLLKKDSAQAEKNFNQALEINPANMLAFKPIYQHLIQAKQTKVAREYLDKALSKQPKEISLLTFKVELDIEEKKWDEAQSTLNQIAILSHNKILPMYLQANLLQGKGEYSNAVELYTQVLEVVPGHLNSLINLIRSHEALKTRHQAVAYLEKHHTQYPEDPTIVMVLSDIYVANKDFAKAKQLLAKQLEKQPKATTLYMVLAKVESILQKNSNNSKDVVLQGLQQNPNDIRLTMLLANWYEQNGDIDKARDLYKDLSALHPELDSATNNLAFLLIDQGDDVESIKMGLKLAEKFKDSDSPQLQDTYAWGLIKAGKFHDGITVLQSLIIKQPNFPDFRYHLGVGYFKSGNKASALAELTRAISLADEQKTKFAGYDAAKKLLQELGAK